MMDYIWMIYVLIGFAAGIVSANIVWFSRVWGILHVSERDETINYAIELTGPFEEVVNNKYVVLRTSHK